MWKQTSVQVAEPGPWPPATTQPKTNHFLPSTQTHPAPGPLANQMKSQLEFGPSQLTVHGLGQGMGLSFCGSSVSLWPSVSSPKRNGGAKSPWDLSEDWM